MNYKSHLNGGIIASCFTAGGFLILSLNPIIALICGLVTLVMSLYPDLDTSSKPSRYFYIAGIPTAIYLFYTGQIIPASIVTGLLVIPKFFKHRGFVHTIRYGIIASACIGYMLFPLVGIWALWMIIGSGIVGYMTHLVMDGHVRF